MNPQPMATITAVYEVKGKIRVHTRRMPLWEALDWKDDRITQRVPNNAISIEVEPEI